MSDRRPILPRRKVWKRKGPMKRYDGFAIEELVVGPLATNCYIVSCTESSEAIIIDPGGDAGSISEAVSGSGVKPVKVVLTHGHSDHMAAAPKLMREYGIGLALHGDDIVTMKKSVEDAPMWGLGKVEHAEVDTILSAGDRIRFGGVSASVVHTPGHTIGGISILLPGVVFAGDTLFAGSIGRTDFFGGDMKTLLDSIRRELFVLPDDTVVFCGHGPSTLIGEEKRHNPFLNGSF